MPSTRAPIRTETIDLQGTTVSYVVRRHPRAKSARITITPFHGVVVTLPARLVRYYNPEEFLREKQEWVLEQLAKLDIAPVPQPFGEGSTIHFLGSQYTVRVQPGSLWPGCELAGADMRVHLPLDFEGSVKDIVLAWIKQEALLRIAVATREIADMIGVTYERLTVRDQKTKWGSCSKNGNISLNWRLVLFPPEVMRYIIIHELCHLKHFNHSPRFWKLVAQHDPAYRTSVEWLREHGLRMEAALR